MLRIFIEGFLSLVCEKFAQFSLDIYLRNNDESRRDKRNGLIEKSSPEGRHLGKDSLY